MPTSSLGEPLMPNSSRRAQCLVCGTLTMWFMASLVMAGSGPWQNNGETPVSSNHRETGKAGAYSQFASFTPASGNRHIVVKFEGHVDSGQRAELGRSGVKMLDYLGDNTFFASITASSKTTVGVMVGASAIEPRWKLHSTFATKARPIWAALGNPTLPDPMVAVYVLFHNDVALWPDCHDAVGRCGGFVTGDLKSVNGLVVELPMSQIDVLAADDRVKYIEPALPRMGASNDGSRALVGADTVQSAPYNLSGNGVSVLVYDVGGASNSLGVPHPDVSGRMFLGDATPAAGHSMHVACTIGGDGGVTGTWRGMAPAVQLLSYGFEFDGTETFLYSNPGDLEADYAAAIAHPSFPADLANNSIGTNIKCNGINFPATFPCSFTGDYGVTSMLIDSIVRGNTATMGKPFRIIWSNGNERSTTCGGTLPGDRCTGVPGGQTLDGYHSTSPPSCAKNHIAVGAVNSDDDSITSFTSWGPCDDGRLKPDIVAPGCQNGGGIESCAALFGTFGYTSLCGTSMAAPTMTGLAALLLEDFRIQFPDAPDFRNSTLKILFAHNAVDIGNPGPDYQSGYGSARIQPTIDFMRTGQFVEEQVDHLATYTITAHVNPGDPELKVTLAWDDPPPGMPNMIPALVNDLDLRVIGPLPETTEFLPWTLDVNNPALPAVRTAPDKLNNIEQVVISAPAVGDYRVEVFGFNVPLGPQVFSLAGSPVLAVPNRGSLTPTSANVPIATAHTVTGRLTEGFAPFTAVVNAAVTIDVLSGPNIGTTASGVTDANGEFSLTYNGGNVPGTDEIQATFDDAGTIRISNVATATWVPGQVSLSPLTANGTECTGHAVTASVTQGAPPFAPLPSLSVAFDVLLGPSAGVTGSGVTDASGTATFTYFGSPGPGTDTIQASFEDGGATQLSNNATITWSASASDCNINSMSDECEPGGNTDCNMNGTPDVCDLAPSVSFDAPTPPAGYPVDPNPIAIITADLDGVPGLDLATANRGTASVSVLLNNGDGTYAPAMSNAIDKNAIGIVTADFDADGVQDLAAGTTNDTVSVLHNDGAAVFTELGPFATGGNNISAISTGDFDGMMGPDLVVASSREVGVDFVVTVMLNSGTGTFPNAVHYSVSNASITFGDTPEHIAVGDFDGVNGLDIAVLNTGDDTISILLNNGDGTFGPPAGFSASFRPTWVSAFDVDHDSDVDLILLAENVSGTPGVRVLRNNGLAGFLSPFLFYEGAGQSPATLAVDDLDKDGDMDLVITNHGSIVTPGTTISVLLNDSSGVYVSQPQIDTGIDFPQGVIVADLNQDGDSDLAATHENFIDTVSVMLGHVTFTSLDCDGNAVPDECDPDANGDGIPDACAGGSCSGVPDECITLTDQCNIGMCNLTTNMCEAIPIANGTNCDDGVFCNGAETCLAGSCIAGPAVCTASCEHCDEMALDCRLCTTDLDADGAVGASDITMFIGCFGACYAPTDPCAAANMDGDAGGCVGTGDYSVLVGCMNQTCGTCSNCNGPPTIP